jgi:hypothetical protein
MSFTVLGVVDALEHPNVATAKIRITTVAHGLTLDLVMAASLVAIMRRGGV